MRARLRAPAGSPDHDKGGAVSAPSQVKRRGMEPPSAKAVERRFRGAAWAMRSPRSGSVPPGHGTPLDSAGRRGYSWLGDDGQPARLSEEETCRTTSGTTAGS